MFFRMNEQITAAGKRLRDDPSQSMRGRFQMRVTRPSAPDQHADSGSSGKSDRDSRAIPKRSKPNLRVPSVDELPARIRTIATLRGLGYSYREIGRQLNVTPQAVSLMLNRHRRSLETIGSSVELACLSARAVNALGRHGIRTPEEARRADIITRLGNERNCGRKTLEEIKRWVGDNEKAAVCRSLPDGSVQTSSSRNCP